MLHRRRFLSQVAVCAFAALAITSCSDAGPGGTATSTTRDASADARCPGTPIPADLLRRPSWTAKLPSDGFQLSSPRAADLNGDDVLDIVVGHGKGLSIGGVQAIDGKDGSTLWSWDAGGEVFATAAVARIDGDDFDDVVFGGRNDTVVALSGGTGKEIWRMSTRNSPAAADTSSVLPIGDRTGDGVVDFAAGRSGGLDSERPAGEIFVLDGATGTQLALGRTANGKETYTPPVVAPGAPATGLPSFVYGLGGETLPASIATSQAVAEGEWPVVWDVDDPGGAKRGIITAPTVLAAAGGPTGTAFTTFDGFAGVIDPNGKILWAAKFGEGSYTSPTPQRTRAGLRLVVGAPPAVGDEDVAGKPADLPGRLQFVDPASGTLTGETKAPQATVPSPATADLNGDGDDDIVLSASNLALGADPGTGSTQLLVVDGCRGTIAASTDTKGGMLSTPLVTDLDRDGNVDLVFAHGFAVVRYRTTLPMPAQPTWPQLFGPKGDATLR